MRHMALVLAATAAASLGTAHSVRADVSVGVGNGDRVSGTIDPADAEETLRVTVPKDARLTITVRGTRLRRRGPPPIMGFDVFEPGGGLLGSSTTRGTTGRLTAIVARGGEHRVVLAGDGTRVGNYRAVIRWRSTRSVPFAGELTAANPTFEVGFDADEGALLTLVQARAPRGSAALPRLATLNGDALPQPTNAGARAHTLRRLPDGGLDFGNSTLVVTNAGADGRFAGKLRIRPPRPSRRNIALTDAKILPVAGDQAATGEVVDDDGGLVAVEGAEFGDIEGSSVNVPAGALAKPTAIVIATSREIPPQSDDDGGAGPTVLFGPEGQQFAAPVEVTIPFDPAPFQGDTSTMRVFTRSSRGRVREITDFTVDAVTNTVSFFVTSFSSFRAFAPAAAASPIPGLVPPDVNDDGVEDLIIPAPEAGGTAGAVIVFFGGSLSPGDNLVTSGDVRIAGILSGDRLGGNVLVRDVNGDGVADILASDANGEGHVYLFEGGTGFSASGIGDADAMFNGQFGDGNFGGGIAVGDVNADGTLDLLVGAEDGDDSGGTQTGVVYVFLGPLSGVNSSGQADLALEGEEADDLFGAGVAAADVTGDGVHDLIVGADMVDKAGGAGRLYVFAGGAGFTSRASGAETAEIQITGEAAGDGFGLGIAVGLVDTDTTADIVTNKGVESDTVSGAIYLFLGGPSLTSGSASTASAKITGTGTDDEFGGTLLVQQIDGDPGGEIVASAEDEGATGRVYVFSGNGLTSGTVTARSATNIVGVNSSDTFGRLAPGVPFGSSIGIAIYAPEFNAGVGFEGRGYVFTSFPAPGTLASDAAITVTGEPGDRLTGEDD